jgi:hypothetical protein
MKSMTVGMFLSVLTGGILAVQSFACEPLALPPGATGDGGTVTPVPDGGTPSPSDLPSFIPQGAKIGEVTDPGFRAGAVITWAVLDANGTVTEVSFSLPLSMVRAVRGTDQRFAARMPQEAIDQTVIRSLALNFYENGHIPPGVYDTPHWEFHPQSILEEDVQKIDCSDPTHVSPDVIPEGHVVPPAEALPCMPLMGFHGLAMSAPEFNGQRFRAGAHLITYYRGDWIAFEPKLANEVMFKRETVVEELPWVPNIDRPALYPKKFIMEYHEAEDTYLFRHTEFMHHD